MKAPLQEPEFVWASQILPGEDLSVKVRGPFVQTLCIEKDSYMDPI